MHSDVYLGNGEHNTHTRSVAVMHINVGFATKKIACHRFGWMVFQRVQCFDPNTKRTNRKTQTPSYL